jgi:hypothetical protein
VIAIARMLFALTLVSVCAPAEVTAKIPTAVKYIVTFDPETDEHLVAIDLTERVTRYLLEGTNVIATGNADMQPTFPKLLPELACIRGVERVELDGHTVFVHKGRVFEWSDVMPSVLATVKRIVAPRAEWKEMQSKYPLRLEKVISELNVTPQ